MNAIKQQIEIVGYFADAHLSDADAQVIGPELTHLAESGALTADDVVEAARAEDSSLHKYFEWDDTRAAELHRQQQARELMRHIKVMVQVPNRDEPYEARAFYAVRVMGEDKQLVGLRQYQTVRMIAADADKSQQVLDQAWQNLVRWKERYETYCKLFPTFQARFGPIFEAIDTAQVVSEVA